MASPVLAGVGIGGSLLGGIFGASSASQSGEAQAAMYRYQAGIAQMRQRIALQNRDYALQVGTNQALQYGLQAGQQAGKIRAAQGASNIDVGGDTSVAVRASQRTGTELSEKAIAENTARTAYGYVTEAAADQAQAGLYETAATKTEQAIPLRMASSLISGATSVSSKWLQASQQGIFAGQSGGGSQPLGSGTDLTYSTYGFNYG